MNATASQVSSTASPNQPLMPNSTPRAVATPLPPLNPKNTGNKWPTNAASAVRAKAHSPSPHSAPQVLTISTGTSPLAASSNSVSAAAALEPERSTLVAPGLPLP